MTPLVQDNWHEALPIHNKRKQQSATTVIQAWALLLFSTLLAAQWRSCWGTSGKNLWLSLGPEMEFLNVPLHLSFSWSNWRNRQLASDAELTADGCQCETVFWISSNQLLCANMQRGKKHLELDGAVQLSFLLKIPFCCKIQKGNKNSAWPFSLFLRTSGNSYFLPTRQPGSLASVHTHPSLACMQLWGSTRHQ